MTWAVSWKGRRWRHSNGMIIEKRWSLIPGAADKYFFCYKTEEDFHAGNNFTTKQDLKAAKAACT